MPVVLTLDCFQRMVHVECEASDKFWNLVDDRLEYFRSQAGSSLRKLNE